MRNLIFALVIFALADAACAAVNINMTAGSGYDYNQITVFYACTAGEEVRAFSLKVDVTDEGFVIGSDVALSSDYYIHPSSVYFEVASDGNTYISNPGSPIAQQTVNGGVIEMASLYAAGDPNHPNPPSSSGLLLKFSVHLPLGAPKFITLSLDTKRGGIVLKDPNDIPTTNLPQSFCIGMCGGNLCWLCPGQDKGDADGSGSVNALDLLAVRRAWLTTSVGSPHGKDPGQYNCCADFTRDGSVNALDYLKLRQNWLKTGLGTCSDLRCL